MTTERETRATGEGDARDRKQAQSGSAAHKRNNTSHLFATVRPAGSEHHLQASVAEFLGYALPPHEALFLSIPNGGKRDKGTAGKLKAEGLHQGAQESHLGVPAGLDRGGDRGDQGVGRTGFGHGKDFRFAGAAS